VAKDKLRLGEPSAALRILLVAPPGSAHTRRWTRDLTARGHQVMVGGLPSPRREGASIRPAAFVQWGCRAVRAACHLRRAARQTEPDIIHVHSLGTHALLALALPRAAPAVITPWGSEVRAAERSAIRRLIARRALRRADLVLPTSVEVATNIARRYYPARIQTLSWGVPDALLDCDGESEPAAALRHRLGVPSCAEIVLSVRSTSATYRTSEIVSAFARVASSRPRLFLVVLVGHRPDRAPARQAQERYLAAIRAQAARLGGRVLIIDELLSHRATYDLMRAAAVAISVPESDQRSSSVLEAAMAGCRLLISDIAPYREMVADGLKAELLREPLSASLTVALAQPAQLAQGDQQANQLFIRRHERGSAKLTELESHYRQLISQFCRSERRGATDALRASH
jgi:glycosyltransferase involved in cell wall biosynthesis